MPSPAFHNHTCDSSAETTISHQLPGACHHAILSYHGSIFGHCGAEMDAGEGGGTISCPQGKSYKTHLASSTDTTRCGCVGAGVSTLKRKRARQTGMGRPPIRGWVQKAHSEDRGRKAHGQTEHPELSGAQRGPGCGQDAARAGNTVARTQQDRGGRMARACIPAGMRCTCLKLRDLVSACESSSSSGSPSGPPASSSPAPAPRTADHVHLAHCTGDRICQGLNAMSAAAAPAVGTAASFLQNGGAVTGAGDPRMWLNERAPSGRAQRFLPRPAAPLAPAPPSRRATRSPPRAPARPPVPSLSPSLRARLGSGVGSRLEQPGPPRSRAPGAAPSDRTTGAARGGDGWEGFGARSPRRAGRARPCSGRGCPTARPIALARLPSLPAGTRACSSPCRAPPTSVS